MKKSTCQDASHTSFAVNAEKLLRNKGYRITQARKSILRILESSSNPMTAKDVHMILQSDSGVNEADLTSVYRTLETLLENALVHQVLPSGAYIACLHSTCSSKHHVIMTCEKCSKSEELDIPEETISGLLDFIDSEREFTPSEHSIHIGGMCKLCRA